MFLLGVFQASYGIKYRLKGIRQFLTLGCDLGNPGGDSPNAATHYAEEEFVTSPFFTFSDGGGVSWHLRRFSYDGIAKRSFGPLDTNNFIWRISKSPALLYEDATFPAKDLNPAGKPDFYTTMTKYTPPRKGQPPGDALVGDWSTFYDQRVWSRSDNAWRSLDVPFDGGDYAIGLFASVRQTNPATRVQPTYPITPFPNPGGFSQEEKFLQNFPTRAIFWRVGGGLYIVEE